MDTAWYVCEKRLSSQCDLWGEHGEGKLQSEAEWGGLGKKKKSFDAMENIRQWNFVGVYANNNPLIINHVLYTTNTRWLRWQKLKQTFVSETILWIFRASYIFAYAFLKKKGNDTHGWATPRRKHPVKILDFCTCFSANISTSLSSLLILFPMITWSEDSFCWKKEVSQNMLTSD